MTFRVLFLLIVNLPPWHQDIEEPGRIERLVRITSASWDAADRATCAGEPETCVPIWPPAYRDDLLLLKLAVAWEETKLARHVHEGRCRRWECDAQLRNGRIVHLARGPWQIQQSALTRDEWPRILGADQASTDAGAWASAKVLAHGFARCKTMHGAVSVYLTGRTCRHPEARRRMQTFYRLKRKAALLAEAQGD
jgi:hypothetical protein